MHPTLLATYRYIGLGPLCINTWNDYHAPLFAINHIRDNMGKRGAENYALLQSVWNTLIKLLCSGLESLPAHEHTQSK